MKKEGAPVEINGEGAHGGFFFDIRGPIYQYTVPNEVKIDAAYYCGVLQQLKRHIQMKRMELKY